MYLNKEKYINHLKETGEVSKEQTTLMLIMEYFSEGKSIDDYKNDLIKSFDDDEDHEEYINGVIDCTINALKRYACEKKENCKEWTESEGVEDCKNCYNDECLMKENSTFN